MIRRKLCVLLNSVEVINAIDVIKKKRTIDDKATDEIENKIVLKKNE